MQVQVQLDIYSYLKKLNPRIVVRCPKAKYVSSISKYLQAIVAVNFQNIQKNLTNELFGLNVSLQVLPAILRTQ